MVTEKKLKEIINEIYDKKNKGLKDEASKLLQDAHDTKNLLIWFTEEECDPFDFFEVLSEVEIRSDLNIDEFLKYARKAYERVQRDFCAYKQYDAIRPILNQNISKLEELEIKLCGLNEAFISGYLREISNIWIENNLANFDLTLDKIKQCTNKNALAGYLGAICDINYEQHSNLIDKTFDVLDTLYNKDPELSNLVVFSYGRLFKYSDSTQERLMFFKDTKSQETKGQLANFLFQINSEHGKEIWFNELLLSLTDISCSLKGAIDKIDFMLDDKEDTFIEKFLILWIENSDFNPHQHDLCELFNSTSYKIIKDTKYLSELLVRFFNSDNKKIIHSASDIVKFHKLHSGSYLSLSIDELKKLNEKDYIYITRKILSCIFDIEHTCPFLMSIIYSIDNINFRNIIIEQAFLPFVCYEYPQCIDKHLNTELELNKDDENKISCIRDINQRLEIYRKAREFITPLKELEISSDLVLKLRKAKHQRMSKSLEDSEKDSPFMSIMSKVPIKYGHATFFFGEKAYIGPSPMVSFSKSIDLPLSELFHPTAAALERYDFNIAKRGEE